MTGLAGLVLLGDLDLLLHEAADPAACRRLRKLGFTLDGRARLEAARQRVVRAIERRWMVAYERAHQRYGRGIAAVRERVCLGCFVTLPTAATRPGIDADPAASLGVPGQCASCGRVLYWP